jgi:hypothetical protein
MNKLLRLYLKIYFKTILKFLLISITLPLTAALIFTIPMVAIFPFMAGIFYILCLTNQSIRFYGDNLSWLSIAPVSKQRLIIYNFLTRSSHFLISAFVPLAILLIPIFLGLEKISKASRIGFGFSIPTSLSGVPTTFWAICFLGGWFFLCLSSLFQKSKIEITPLNIKKLNKADYLILAPLFLSWTFFEMSLLIIATLGTGVLLYYTLNHLKKELVLVKVPKFFIYSTPVAMSLIAFLVFKGISDNNLNNPKLSLDSKITEIKFQMKFTSYLSEAKLVEFLHSGLTADDYMLLKEVYSDWKGFENFINTHKESNYLSLLKGQKNPEMLKEIFLLFEPTRLSSQEIDNYLSIADKMGRKKISTDEYNHLTKTKLSRGDLMNYLVSNNSLKQYVAASFAEKRELHLVPEILRNISSFNDETLAKAKHSISQNYCRQVSSVEIMNAYKNQEVELPSNCKNDLRLPANSK